MNVPTVCFGLRPAARGLRDATLMAARPSCSKLRRLRARVIRTAALLIIGAVAGCSTTTHADAPPPTTAAPPLTSAAHAPRLPPSTPAAPPAASSSPPPLATPPPIAPLVSPPLAGEGDWQPAGDKLANGYAIYTTGLRPAAGQPVAGVAWIDTDATTISLYAGTSEPYGTWPQQGAVGAAQQPTLMAAFNSGFRVYAYHTGWYDQGRTAVPLQAGAASLVIFANGSATVADWGRDVTPGPTIVAVRQNVTLLVDNGVASPQINSPSQWGAVLGGGITTWRSGIGTTAAGDLVYAAGAKLDPASLARLLIAAGAVRAMELDINPQWVSLATFTHTAGIGSGGVTGINLLAGMYYQPDHYLQPFSRDFLAVFAR